MDEWFEELLAQPAHEHAAALKPTVLEERFADSPQRLVQHSIPPSSYYIIEPYLKTTINNLNLGRMMPLIMEILKAFLMSQNMLVILIAVVN